MNESREPEDQLTAAERRLHVHLQLLRADTPEPTPSLVTAIVRKARWQGALRIPLQAVGALAAAISDGVRLLFPTQREER